uniref:Uncharacterized protein n=1 Tax=Cacopsylla melanoneura TaxID=428564 RepID=A0A8D8VYS0_9HEMI
MAICSLLSYIFWRNATKSQNLLTVQFVLCEAKNKRLIKYSISAGAKTFLNPKNTFSDNVKKRKSNENDEESDSDENSPSIAHDASRSSKNQYKKERKIGRKEQTFCQDESDLDEQPRKISEKRNSDKTPRRKVVETTESRSDNDTTNEHNIIGNENREKSKRKTVGTCSERRKFVKESSYKADVKIKVSSKNTLDLPKISPIKQTPTVTAQPKIQTGKFETTVFSNLGNTSFLRTGKYAQIVKDLHLDLSDEMYAEIVQNLPYFEKKYETATEPPDVPITGDPFPDIKIESDWSGSLHEDLFGDYYDNVTSPKR